MSVPEDVVVDKITRTNVFHKPWNNRYEMHRGHWERDEFLSVCHAVEFYPCEGFIVASLSPSKETPDPPSIGIPQPGDVSTNRGAREGVITPPNLRVQDGAGRGDADHGPGHPPE